MTVVLGPEERAKILRVAREITTGEDRLLIRLSQLDDRRLELLHRCSVEEVRGAVQSVEIAERTGHGVDRAHEMLAAFVLFHQAQTRVEVQTLDMARP